MKIDAHHHFWKYDPQEYDWIGGEMSVICRDFLPPDLEAEIAHAGVDAVVSVQARQTLVETEWLLAMAERNDFIRGVVGWVPLISTDAGHVLERFARNPKFKSVRHVLQGEPDERYMLRDDFNRGVSALLRFGLAYDILIFERQLPQTIEFVDRHPQQIFVLDHIAKPRIKEGIFEPWNRNIRELAKRENVFCKISGIVTEADWSTWTTDALMPYAETVIEAFGPSRVMFGSDWPVCLVASGYRQWLQTVEQFASHLSDEERVQIFGATAARAYKL